LARSAFAWQRVVEKTTDMVWGRFNSSGRFLYFVEEHVIYF
jgi:hypothetical protein